MNRELNQGQECGNTESGRAGDRGRTDTSEEAIHSENRRWRTRRSQKVIQTPNLLQPNIFQESVLVDEMLSVSGHHWKRNDSAVRG